MYVVSTPQVRRTKAWIRDLAPQTSVAQAALLAGPIFARLHLTVDYLFPVGHISIVRRNAAPERPTKKEYVVFAQFGLSEFATGNGGVTSHR